MPGRAEPYYWDACLFLAWLKDERRVVKGEMDGVREFINRFKRREIMLMTSTITYAEVTESKRPVGTLHLFDDLMKRPKFNKISVDIRVSKLARQLRDYYSSKFDEYGNKTLSVPDAIHLATAILYKAVEFHTFDKKSRKKSLGLLPLSGNVGGHNLIITKPAANQPGLDLRP